METTLAQVANEILGVPIDRIKVVLGDTALTPFSTGTYASRGMVMAGGAVSVACKALIKNIVHIGAHLLQDHVGAVSFVRGTVVGRTGRVCLADIAYAWYPRPERLPPDVDPTGLEATVGYRPRADTGAFSYASHAALVAVDPETGHVAILDYVIADDCGRMVNPMVVEGQTYGGAAQGIGTALYEEMT